MFAAQVPPARTRRHAELLEQLLGVFLADGFRRFTLDDLTARVHCSKTTLYSLGRSKEDVILNVVTHFYRTATEYIEERTAEADDPIDRVVAYLEAAAETLRPASPQFHADVRADPAARAIYELNKRAAVDRIRELIAEGTRAGAFRDIHALFVAEVVTDTISRIHDGDITTRTRLSVADAYRELATLVLSGIRSGD